MIDEPKRSKYGCLKDINGVKRRFEIVKEIRQKQHNADKVLVFQTLHFLDTNKTEFRIGYYIKGKKPRMRGKWVWGQYNPQFPKRDFYALMWKVGLKPIKNDGKRKKRQ